MTVEACSAGIDVSSNNHSGGPFDYPAIVDFLHRRNGPLPRPPFVIVKATEGAGYVNPYFQADLNGFRAAGANVLAYLYDHGMTSPTSEQAKFASVAGVLTELIDPESPDGLSPQAYGAHVQTLADLKPQAFVYLNKSELAAFPGAPWHHPLVLADWGVMTPSVPCALWQYGSGAVPSVVGAVDADLWLDVGLYDATFPASAPVPPPTNRPPYPGHVVKVGDRGDLVRMVQFRLSSLGIGTLPDGIFGPWTLRSVRRFQGEHKLQVDGIVGPKTWGALWPS